VIARVELEGHGSGSVTLVSVHLDHKSATERLAQAARLLEILSSFKSEPVVLAGDLNDVPQSGVLELFESSWTNSTKGAIRLTIPSEKPNRQIDYVLAYPAARWRVIETQVIASAASDHCALLAVLELH
jgi:endonuclease/exonuclease/phosphatase family metal-dependent hydrolase